MPELPVTSPSPAPHSALRVGSQGMRTACRDVLDADTQRERARDGVATLITMAERSLPSAAARVNDARTAQEQAVESAGCNLDARSRKHGWAGRGDGLAPVLAEAEMCNEGLAFFTERRPALC